MADERKTWMRKALTGNPGRNGLVVTKLTGYLPKPKPPEPSA